MVTASSTAIATLVGYASALPTPFAGDGLDEAAFVALCHWQIEEGISALVVNGTTGEAPTLSEMEQTRLLRLAVAAADRRVPVIAGAGSSATMHAVALARSAERAGADAILAVTPYYNRPSQEGLFWHFQALHEAVALPILLYDVPSRTGCALAIETICRLAALPRIVGLKDATGDLTRPGVLRRLLGNRFRLLSGDDATALDFMALGGDGCISVLSNVVPKLCNRLHLACACGEAGEARAIERTLMPLTRALFAESNPVPLKWALSLMARMGPTVRLPLCEPAAATRAAVGQSLETLHLLAPPSRLRSIGRAVSLCH